MGDPVVLRSVVQSVSVFRSGAVVQRLAPFPAGPWPEEVAIDALPLSLSDDSVRVSVQGEGAESALPRPADMRIELVIPALGESLVPPSQKEIQAAEDELERLQALHSRVQQELAFVDGVKFQLPPLVPNRAPRSAPAAAWSGALEWTGRAKKARIEEKAALEARIRTASEELQRLRRREDEAQSRRGAEGEAVRKRLRVRLREGGATPSKASLSVEYRIPGARWRPSYVVRMARDGRSALLSVRALVVQQSGEPWDRVKLSLSTADLLASTEIPELNSMRIGRRQPPQPAAKAWRAPPQGLEGLFEGVDRALPPADSNDDFSRQIPLMPPPPPRELPARPMKKSAPVSPPRAPMAPPMPVPMAAPSSVVRSRGGAASTPPSQPAFGMAPPAAKSESLSADLGGYDQEKESGAANVPSDLARSDSRAPGSRPLGRRASLEMDGAAGGAAMADDESPSGSMAAPSEPRPDLRYADLLMGSWNDPGWPRGKLKPLTTADRLRGVSGEAASTVEARIADANAKAVAAGRAEFPGDTRPPEQSAGSYDYRYDAEGLVDIPSDGLVHGVPLLGRRAPVATTLVIVPRESTQAVRVASLKNPLDSPLLEGPAEIYLEDEFLVAAPIRTVPAGAELKVGLGVEEALKVARNVHFEEEKAGLLGGSATLTHKVDIEVTSRMALPVRVEVRERVPIKGDEQARDIDIAVPEPPTPWEPFDQAETTRIKGGRRWRFSLSAGESKKLSWSYVVKIDSKNEVVGGNRRE